MAKTKKWNKVIARIEALEKALASLMTGGGQKKKKRKKTKKKAPKARTHKAKSAARKSGKTTKTGKPRLAAQVVVPQPPLVSF